MDFQQLTVAVCKEPCMG